MIHHLSYPRNSSVNDLIPHEFSSVHYASIYDAIKFIKKTNYCILGQWTAFRIIPISTLDRPLLSETRENVDYIENQMRINNLRIEGVP